MKLRAQFFAIAAALLLGGALFGIVFWAGSLPSRRTAPSAPPQPSAPTTANLVITQSVPGGPIIVATQLPGGSLLVMTQFSLPFVRQPGRTEEGVILYDGLLPRDLEPWTRRGYYDLIDFRYAPELDLKKEP